MSKKNFLNDLASQITDALPSHVTALKNDFEKSCQQILTQTFNKLDLITREEFDVQTKVLARTRKRLEELQEQIKTLENIVNNKHGQ